MSSSLRLAREFCGLAEETEIDAAAGSLIAGEPTDGSLLHSSGCQKRRSILGFLCLLL
jgi:hypothetical protein